MSIIINPTTLAKNNAVQLLSTDTAAYNADIILVTKTWFKTHHNKSFTDKVGYNCFRFDRCKRRGGGVCIYVKSIIKATRVLFTNTVENAEYLWINFEIGNMSVFLCCCYHPRKPCYSSSELIDMLCMHINNILSSNSNAVLILAGDLNKLDCSKFEIDQGVIQLVNQTTHSRSVLDKCLTNRPDLYSSVSVISSLIDTKHKAVFIESCSKGRNGKTDDGIKQNTAGKIVIYNRSPDSIERLRKAFTSYSWSGLLNSVECGTIDVSTAFSDFYTIVKWHLEKFIPTKTVSVKAKDPSFCLSLLPPSKHYCVKEID